MTSHPNDSPPNDHKSNATWTNDHQSNATWTNVIQQNGSNQITVIQITVPLTRIHKMTSFRMSKRQNDLRREMPLGKMSFDDLTLGTKGQFEKKVCSKVKST